MSVTPGNRRPPVCWVAGHRGMVGSALVRALQARGDRQLVTADRSDLDLTDQGATRQFLERERPDQVIVAAARVGGIEANRTQPAAFLYENLAIASNVIHGAFEAGVPRLLFLGSSCIYPREAPQPIAEDSLLTGPLEPTNEAYAIAKIAGLKLCQYYRRQHGAQYHSIMPTNLYGPGDHYHPEHSHVIPGLIRRIHRAREQGEKSVTIWGTGAPRREFLHVDDLAAACLHLLDLADPPDWVNAGSGEEITILDLARLIAAHLGYRGDIRTDPTKPDGTPRKRLDTALMESLGWCARLPLDQGLRDTCAAFEKELAAGTLRS
jgi:GDP-L-fucose synthase